MRVIKFRAWDTTSKKMYSQENIQDYTLEQLTRLTLTDDPYTKFMQFTGLQDINGVDIYEGDIVSLWYAPRATARGKIKFENGGFYFKTTEAKPEIELAYNCVYEHGNSFTVIGNIHENPELLEVQ